MILCLQPKTTKKSLSNFVVIIVAADGIALQGAWTSIGLYSDDPFQVKYLTMAYKGVP